MKIKYIGEPYLNNCQKLDLNRKIKKYRITGKRYNGSSWTHNDFDYIVEAYNKEDVKKKYGGLQPDMDEVFIENIEELKE